VDEELVDARQVDAQQCVCARISFAIRHSPLSILPLLGKRIVKIHPKLEIEPGLFPIAIGGGCVNTESKKFLSNPYHSFNSCVKLRVVKILGRNRQSRNPCSFG
jgi:hypothetical protein